MQIQLTAQRNFPAEAGRPYLSHTQVLNQLHFYVTARRREMET